MSPLINGHLLSKSYGSQTLFQNLSLSIFEGDRLGLIGPNGVGKSTLLKILTGIEDPDSGTLSQRKDLKVGFVPQVNVFDEKSPLQIVIEAIEEPLSEFEKEELAYTQLKRLGFKGDEEKAHLLSGGWKKRLALAVALVNTPDLLLLDEPTNHLDLEAVLWLEKFLLREVKTLLFVSHDRMFLQTLANRIVDIDPLYPEGLLSISCKYDEFQEKKELFIEGQLQKERSIATKMRRETEWLRTSPKARTTKSVARIQQAEEIIEEHAATKMRNKKREATVAFVSSERETRKLITLNNIGYEVGGRVLFKNLHFTFQKGTRVGLLGANGSGKTTFLKILAGELAPTQGTIKYADDLKIVYFDQHRTKLPLDMKLKDALSPNGDYVNFQGQQIHVNGWCRRFLFSSDSLSMPIGKLSGGERARIAIAHLSLQPADILLLDEPANDLDITTLQILEENLLQFPGALVLITHDRTMQNTICNHFLALKEGEPMDHYTSFAEWENRSKESSAPPKETAKKSPSKKKFSYKEKKEYEEIEALIAKEEKHLKEMQEEMASGLIQDHVQFNALCEACAESERKIEQLIERFTELDSIIN